MIKKECNFCNKEFEARRNTAKYCCNSCRTKSYMVRNGKGDGTLREGMGLRGLNNEKNLTRTQKDIFGNEFEMDELTGKPKIEQKTVSKRTSQDIFIDVGIGVGTTFIGNRLDNFLRSEENKQTQKKDLVLLLKGIERMHIQTFKALNSKIEQLSNKIKKEQGIFY